MNPTAFTSEFRTIVKTITITSSNITKMNNVILTNPPQQTLEKHGKAAMIHSDGGSHASSGFRHDRKFLHFT